MSINLKKLLLPITEAQPCGPLLDEDPGFLALEIAATRHAETEIGGLVTPAKEPDWSVVQQSAIDLLLRSKDLQVAIYLVEALIHTEGLAGFQDGLQLVHSLLDRYWDNLHPELDPSDGDGAASERVMRLKGLGDRARIVRALRQLPILISDRHGRFSLGDVQSLGQPTEGDVDRRIELSTALQDALISIDVALLKTSLMTTIACLDELEAIIGIVDDKADICESLGLESVVETTNDIKAWLEEQLMAKGADVPISNGSERPSIDAIGQETVRDTPSLPSGSRGHEQHAITVSKAGVVSISSRDEALKTIDLLCDYFERHEPSSPVPLILRRAKRLVAKDFMAILRDLVPDGLSQMETMVGGGAAE